MIPKTRCLFALAVLLFCYLLNISAAMTTCRATSPELQAPPVAAVLAAAQSLKMDKTGNPYAHPGYLAYNPERPLAANWLPFDAATAPAPDWVNLLRVAMGLPEPDLQKMQGYDQSSCYDEPKLGAEANEHHSIEEHDNAETRDRRNALTHLEHLRGKTILLIGDSIDRNAVCSLAQLSSSERFLSISRYEDINNTDWQSHYGESQKLPHILRFRELDFTIVNCFATGLDDEDMFSFLEGSAPPSLFEDRIEQLFKPMVAQLPHPPSMITLQSGMWDLPFFGRKTALARMAAGNKELGPSPLTTEQMAWWFARMRSVLDKVQKAWPGVPIVYRTTHRPSTTGSPTTQFLPEHPQLVDQMDFFPDVQVAQIRHMQLALAGERGLHVFDWNTIWEGWHAHQDKVHPVNLPGGLVMTRAILHYAYMLL